MFFAYDELLFVSDSGEALNMAIVNLLGELLQAHTARKHYVPFELGSSRVETMSAIVHVRDDCKSGFLLGGRGPAFKQEMKPSQDKAKDIDGVSKLLAPFQE